MTDKEFAILLKGIRSAYPNYKICDTEQSFEMWFRMLQDLEYQAAINGIKAYIMTNKFPPSIADIRQCTSEASEPILMSWGEGWEQVVKAFGSYGYMRELEALNSMSDITRRVVQQLGWYNLCTSSNIEVDRANFRMLYEQMANVAKKDRVLPIELRISANNTYQLGE